MGYTALMSREASGQVSAERSFEVCSRRPPWNSVTALRMPPDRRRPLSRLARPEGVRCWWSEGSDADFVSFTYDIWGQMLNHRLT